MSDVKITVRNNGPLLIEGPISLLDANGKEWVWQAERKFRFAGAAIRTISPFAMEAITRKAFNRLPKHASFLLQYRNNSHYLISRKFSTNSRSRGPSSSIRITRCQVPRTKEPDSTGSVSAVPIIADNI